MHRPIPGARFLASVLAGASLFGGATALADAGRLGVTHIVDIPVSAAETAVPSALSEEETKAADALAKEADKAAEAALAEWTEPRAPAQARSGPILPRLRPEPAAVDNAG